MGQPSGLMLRDGDGQMKGQTSLYVDPKMWFVGY